jgi:NitT/TauT family transport system permease protein
MSEMLPTTVVTGEPNRLTDKRRNILRPLPSLLMALAILIVWELFTQVFNIQQFLLPSPSTILKAFVENGEQLAFSARMAVFEAAGGLLLGTLFATVAGLAAARWNIVGRALIPFAIGLNAVPTLVFAPIMNNWFGSINPMSKMMIVVTLVYYPIMINVVRGLTLVEPSALEVMQSYGAKEREIFTKLRFPNMLPFFFNALKIGATLSVIGTVVAGYFGGQRAALGVWILNQVILFRFPPAWSGILVACLIGISFYLVISLAERLVLPWHSSMRSDNQ